MRFLRSMLRSDKRGSHCEGDVRIIARYSRGLSMPSTGEPRTHALICLELWGADHVTPSQSQGSRNYAGMTPSHTLSHNSPSKRGTSPSATVLHLARDRLLLIGEVLFRALASVDGGDHFACSKVARK